MGNRVTFLTPLFCAGCCEPPENRLISYKINNAFSKNDGLWFHANRIKY